MVKVKVSQTENAEILAAEQRVQRGRDTGAAEDATEPRPGPGLSRISQAWQVQWYPHGGLVLQESLLGVADPSGRDQGGQEEQLRGPRSQRAGREKLSDDAQEQGQAHHQQVQREPTDAPQDADPKVRSPYLFSDFDGSGGFILMCLVKCGFYVVFHLFG